MTDAERLAEIKTALEESGFKDWGQRGTVAIISDLCQQVRKIHVNQRRLDCLEAGTAEIMVLFERAANARLKGDKKTAKALIAEAYKATESLRVRRD